MVHSLFKNLYVKFFPKGFEIIRFILYFIYAITPILILLYILKYLGIYDIFSYIYMPDKANKKVIVFDLDETIGYFTQLGVFIKLVEDYTNHKFTTAQNHQLLSLYPELFRSGIMDVFKHLKKHKSDNTKIIIYTNNTGPKSWVMMIKNYIEKQLNGKLFDKVLAGYREGLYGKVQEHSRTTSDKTYEDLVNAVNLSETDKIIFFDDQLHYRMYNTNINYVHLKPYQKLLSLSEFIEKFAESKLGKKLIKDKNKLLFGIKETWNKYQFRQYTEKSINEKNYTTRKILKEIKTFTLFKNKKNSTTKRKKSQRKSKKTKSRKI